MFRRSVKAINSRHTGVRLIILGHGDIGLIIFGHTDKMPVTVVLVEIKGYIVWVEFITKVALQPRLRCLSFVCSVHMLEVQVLGSNFEKEIAKLALGNKPICLLVCFIHSEL